MGTTYNAAHISEAQVKEAWANYSKYDYYYTTEIAKAKESLTKQTASAKSQLAAKGIFETDTKYQSELDRITNIAQADITSLTKGQQNLQTGAIKELLTSGDISKYSKGNYAGYLQGYEMQGRLLASQSTGGLRVLSSPGREITAPEKERMDAAEASLAARGPAQTMSEYYSKVFGAYDATAEIKKEQKMTSEESARGQAGSRAYNIQSQPKGRPGGGKPGNVFMQTPQEVAQEQAPQDEQRKAWWM
jgi:hypothetical protein